ncbi:M16 family metallopeptidase [Gaoshiqia sp. Z1-71]|uniref:M16 family metallopeptidase n=1 Tax=Gaoshiqia hydrogeniformans TaxID=3290090 RepID=UPI003BF78309
MKQLFSFLFLLLSVFGVAQQPHDSLLPVDQKVSKGVLENGMTYYVRSNSTPKNRADLYLVVRAGSIDEDDDQQGLAHFAEHMAFNGTENFPKNELIKYLESIGMEFGPEVNAYTSFDETVYMIKVPLDEDEYIENGLQVLYDWACQTTDSDEEIEKERGVIHEEWRGGRGANERMMQKWIPVLLHESRYAERLPIGKIDIIDNCPPEVLRRYRSDWYRPDLQAVVVVGDFDQEEMVKRVKAKFSDIPAKENPRKKEIFAIPRHAETLVSVVTDKEARYPVANIYYKHPLKINKTLADYREGIKHSLFNSMINNRLQELAQLADPPFITAGSAYEELFGPVSVYSSGVLCQNGQIERGIKAVVEENERVMRYGFTASELERMKNALLASIEKSYNERDKQRSEAYAEEYKRNFLMTEEPIPGIENEFLYYRQFLPGITLDEVNALAKKWITDENRVVVVTAPEIEGIKVPSEDEVLAILNEVENSPLDAYDDVIADKPLIDQEIVPGEVVGKKQLDEIDALEWTLSNGAVVVLKTTDFKDDEVLFTAYSLGGKSLYGQESDISADFAATIVAMSGISGFDKVTLDKMMSDKVFSISPYLRDLTEGFSGRSSVKDLETMMEMLYLYFTDLRVDPQAFSSYMSRYAGFIENRVASPEDAYNDTLQVVSVNYHPRKRPVTKEVLQEASFGTIEKIARERFVNAADFKFFFVGNIDPEAFKPVVERYIGGLPASDKREKWVDMQVKSPDGVVEKTVYRGQEEKSLSHITFHGNFDYSRENLVTIDALGKILSTRLLEVIREDKSSVYSIGARPSVEKMPVPKYSMSIYYGTSPEKVNELKEDIFREIADIAGNGPSEEDLQKAKEKMLRERENNLRENSFWLSVINNGYLYKDGDFSDFSGYEELVNQLTKEKIMEATKAYFNFENYYQVILKPEQK